MTRFLLALSFALSALFATAAEAGSYDVTFDTSTIAGTAGSVDFQWNLGALDPSLVASVSHFAGTSLIDPATVLFGDASGSLAPGGTLSFAASAPFNYVYQSLNFGSSLTFRVTLPDSAPSFAAIASTFVVSLFDAALDPALPTTSPEAAALVFSLAPGDSPVLAQYTAARVAAVPEPGIVALVFAGMAALGAVRRRARRAA